jgi:hypothetical protein
LDNSLKHPFLGFKKSNGAIDAARPVSALMPVLRVVEDVTDVGNAVRAALCPGSGRSSSRRSQNAQITRSST